MPRGPERVRQLPVVPGDRITPLGCPKCMAGVTRFMVRRPGVVEKPACRLAQDFSQSSRNARWEVDYSLKG